ncbi:hypothetical protein DDW44_07315 [Streptomyces tirandamycinicus]|uniref:Uncharacterized protein n=1 Tax=Streptomyces tirandamycinicus TaxID=2174846 RepID=A0A2S1SQE6_9ACTN|nr:hypothetical protein DDW44_07315 [Streptomyces tirandamycinicus]
MSDANETLPAAHEPYGAAQGGSGEPFPVPRPAAGPPDARHATAPADGAAVTREGTGTAVTEAATGIAVTQDATGATVAAGEPAYDPAAPAPLGVQRVPTGHAGVDAHLERLADADHLPADGHLEVYEDVHRGLRDTLTALDARPDDSHDPRS